MDNLSEFEKAVFNGNEDLRALIAVHGSVLLPENAQQIEGATHVEVVARDGRRATVPAATVTKIAPSKDGAMLVGLFIDAAAGSRPFGEELAFLSDQIAMLSGRLAQVEADQIAAQHEIEALKLALEAKPVAESPKEQTPKPPKEQTPKPPKEQTPKPPKEQTPEPPKEQTPEPPKEQTPEPPKP